MEVLAVSRPLSVTKDKERPGRGAGALKKTGRAAAVAAFAAALLAMGAASGAHAEPRTDVDFKGGIDQRRVINPSTYGDIIMNLNLPDSGKNKPVVFKHWTHRAKFQCQVCHTELAFPLKANTVAIKQSDIETGKYCGACHDGKTAFGPSECDKCHSYGSKAGVMKIEEQLANLPKDGFGNKVNWVTSQSEGKISPEWTLPGNPMHKTDKKVLDAEVVIPVTKYAPHPPDVVFPHKAHTEQLDCSSCHPAPFVDKAGANPQMNMMRIISGQYCGMCHDRVSFPLNDCFRCHSKPVPRPEEVKKEDEADKKGAVKDAPKAKPAGKGRRR